MTTREKYQQIVNLYESQVNLSFRTSDTILMQQYSTPAPIAYLMGVFCGMDKIYKSGWTEKFNKQDWAKYEQMSSETKKILANKLSTPIFFEPTAGNGMLTLAGQPKNFIVNELDPVRLKNLRTQGFQQVLNQDATLPFNGFEKKFDAVITNPPFGSTKEPVYYDGFPINGLEHLCALRALDTMANEGKAAIIIGGHTEYDSKGRIQAGKNRIFFSYLYKHYHVMDIINVDGKKLYSRMGTGFNIRIILIDGRKEKPAGFPPLANKELASTEINSSRPVSTFDDLYTRIIKII